MSNELDSLLNNEVASDFVPMTNEEILDLQIRILDVKNGVEGAVRPTREEIERAYTSMRMLRESAAPKRTATTSSAPAMSNEDLDKLFS